MAWKTPSCVSLFVFCTESDVRFGGRHMACMAHSSLRQPIVLCFAHFALFMPLPLSVFCGCDVFAVVCDVVCVLFRVWGFGLGVWGRGLRPGRWFLVCAGHIPPYPEACRRQPARFRKTSTAHITHTTVIAIAGAVARLRAAHDLVIVSTITTYETSEHALPKSLRFLPSIERHETLKNRCKTTPTTEPAGK